MDKCVFYQCQFIGCDKALDLVAARASGGNMWANCLFKDNREYAVRGVNQSPIIFANCDFINNAGHPVVNTNGRMSLIACHFQAGTANPTDLIDSIDVSVEGCRFESAGATTTKLIAEPPNWIPVDFNNLDNANTRSFVNRNIIYYNSSSDLPVGDLRQGMLFNTNFTQDPLYSTRGAYVINRVATTILPGTPDTVPKSQLLVGSGLQFPTAMTSETGSAPSLSSPITVTNVTAGSSFAYAITALHFPTSFSVAGLPSWLSVNTSTGIITGVPPTAGSYSFTVTATNFFGSDSQSVTLTVAAASANAPVIGGTLSITAYLDTAFSYQVVATNAPTGYNAGSLPTGLEINASTGLIFGTPTQIGTRVSSITATNANGTTITSIAIAVLPKVQTPIAPPTTPSGGSASNGSGGGGGCGFGGAAAALALLAGFGLLIRLRL